MSTVNQIMTMYLDPYRNKGRFMNSSTSELGRNFKSLEAEVLIYVPLKQEPSTVWNLAVVINL